MTELSLKERALRGKKLSDLLIIDARGICPAIDGDPFSTALKGMIQMLDNVGVAKVVLVSFLGLGSGEPMLGNRDVEKVVDSYPERFYGWFAFNPNFSEITQETIEEWLRKQGFIGIKIQPNFNKYPVNGKEYARVWEAAAKMRAPVLGHSWNNNRYCDPALFAEVAASYPSVPVILAHSGGTREGYIRTVEFAQERKNMYLELCRVDFSYGQVEYFVKEVGVQRVIYGTDFCPGYIDFRPALGNILFAKVSDEDKKKILGLNMKTIIENIEKQG